MRAYFDINHPTCRDRLAERRGGLRPTGKPRRIARQCATTGRLLTGHASQHKTKQARLWRLRLRLRRARLGTDTESM